MGTRRYWPIVRRIWIALGLTLTIVFVVWSLISYRANFEALAATAEDEDVSVLYTEGIWQFRPKINSKLVTLVFFPGSLVDPKAYAPLARSVAEASYNVLVVELPYRGAFGGADSPELRIRIAAALALIDEKHSVVVGGHSRGAVVATKLSAQSSNYAGVVLIGTSHPRDEDLSKLEIPVTKIVGTHDGLATPEKVNKNANLLPDKTRWVWIEGGNHSQFGWYGFQPMDRKAHISAVEQRKIMTHAVLELLNSVESSKSKVSSVKYNFRANSKSGL